MSRDEYTWEMAGTDLALTTHLSLKQASDLIQPLRDASLHPYDALPWLQQIAAVSIDAPAFGAALYGLLTGEEWRPWASPPTE